MLGYKLYNTKKEKILRSKGVFLNVGCGINKIDGLVNIDYYSNNYYSNNLFNHVHYDIRKDKLPYLDNSVDGIYCSHVIEHIEASYIEKFFKESYRVLKPGSIFRVACPDIKYLYTNLINNPKYFSWHPMYKNIEDAPTCFVDEVASVKAKQHNFGLQKKWFDYSYDELLKELCSDLEYNEESVNQHISAWDFERISVLAKNIGFSYIIKSCFQGSLMEEFRGKDMDLTTPQMSLYVDIKK